MNSDEITITWCIQDIQHIRPDLNDAQAREVLYEIKSNHDASIGINWSVIEYWCEYIFPNKDDLDYDDL